MEPVETVTTEGVPPSDAYERRAIQQRHGRHAIIAWVASAIALAAIVAVGATVDRRERAIEVRSTRVDALVVGVEQDDHALFRWIDDGVARSAWVHFNPGNVKGKLDAGDHVEVLVDAERVHLPGNTTALVGENAALLLAAAPLPLLGGIIAAIVMTVRWKSARRRTR